MSTGKKSVLKKGIDYRKGSTFSQNSTCKSAAIAVKVVAVTALTVAQKSRDELTLLQ